MFKKLFFLAVLSVVLFSCEAESFDDATFSQGNNTELDTEIDEEKIIDRYEETNGGL